MAEIKITVSCLQCGARTQSTKEEWIKGFQCARCHSLVQRPGAQMAPAPVSPVAQGSPAPAPVIQAHSEEAVKAIPLPKKKTINILAKAETSEQKVNFIAKTPLPPGTPIANIAKTNKLPSTSTSSIDQASTSEEEKLHEKIKELELKNVHLQEKISGYKVKEQEQLSNIDNRKQEIELRAIKDQLNVYIDDKKNLEKKLDKLSQKCQALTGENVELKAQEEVLKESLKEKAALAVKEKVSKLTQDMQSKFNTVKEKHEKLLDAFKEKEAVITSLEASLKEKDLAIEALNKGIDSASSKDQTRDQESNLELLKLRKENEILKDKYVSIQVQLEEGSSEAEQKRIKELEKEIQSLKGQLSETSDDDDVIVVMPPN